MTVLVRSMFTTDAVAPKQKRSQCKCPRIESINPYITNSQAKSLPALVASDLKDDLLQVLFRDKTFRFQCPCDLLINLKQNETLRNYVKRIKVHWCGTESPDAFQMLAKCQSLQTLTLTIAKSSLLHLNERANLMKTWFPNSHRTARISDILGLDELLQLRGLKYLNVAHSYPRLGGHGFEIDRANLEEFLSSKVLQDKNIQEWLAHGDEGYTMFALLRCKIVAMDNT